MVVEHTFVTTMEGPEALGHATSFLESFGFVAEAQRAFQLGGTWNAVEMRRGKAKSGRNLPIRDWPQHVRVEWDRGKVDVATSVTPPTRSGWDTRSGKMNTKDAAIVQQLLVTIASSLELLLTTHTRPEDARAELTRLDGELDERARRARRRSRIILIVVISFAAIAIGLLVLAITWSARR